MLQPKSIRNIWATAGSPTLKACVWIRAVAHVKCVIYLTIAFSIVQLHVGLIPVLPLSYTLLVGFSLIWKDVSASGFLRGHVRHLASAPQCESPVVALSSHRWRRARSGRSGRSAVWWLENGGNKCGSGRITRSLSQTHTHTRAQDGGRSWTGCRYGWRRYERSVSQAVAAR